MGRGPVIVRKPQCVVEALQTKRIRGAALDVFDVEPLPADNPIWSLDNVLLTAHTVAH